MDRKVISTLYECKRYPSENEEIENILIETVLALGDIEFLEDFRKIVYAKRNKCINNNDSVSN